MTLTLPRRRFLSLVGLGAAAVGVELVAPYTRKLWQVGRGAPVGKPPLWLSEAPDYVPRIVPEADVERVLFGIQQAESFEAAWANPALGETEWYLADNVTDSQYRKLLKTQARERHQPRVGGSFIDRDEPIGVIESIDQQTGIVTVRLDRGLGRGYTAKCTA